MPVDAIIAQTKFNVRFSQAIKDAVGTIHAEGIAVLSDLVEDQAVGLTFVVARPFNDIQDFSFINGC